MFAGQWSQSKALKRFPGLRPQVPWFFLRHAIMVLLAVSGLSLRVLHAQAPQTTDEKGVKPKAQPEPRRKIPASPEQLRDEITSDKLATRLRGLKVLFGDDVVNYDNSWVEARLYPVQLDDDPDMEYMLVVARQFPPEIFIIDKASDGWYLVGDFESQPVGDIDEATPERHGRYILVRSQASNQDVADIYGLWKGSLYNLLHFVELTGTVTGLTTGLQEVETAGNVSFDEIVDGELRTPGLILRSEKATTLMDKIDKTYKQTGPPTIERTCEGYEWVPSTFSFEHTDRATNALCK